MKKINSTLAKRHVWMLSMIILITACQDDHVVAPTLTAETDTETRNVRILYGDFIKVLRDIEVPDVMTYEEFEKEYRNTNDEERALLKREVHEALQDSSAYRPTDSYEERAHGNSCKSNVVSRLTHSRFKSLGRQRARISWSNKARSRYGWKYRKWSKAKDKDYYHYTDGTDFLLWKYRAYGKPCK
ncbi:MAG: hypothetical protein AAGA66_07395 [Bacteroidota bacterium]